MRKPRVGADHAVLVEQRELAFGFQHALDHEHHVWAARVVFVEHQRGRRLQGPGQQAFAEFGDLKAVAQHDRVAADQVDAADVGIKVDADARPFEARGHLLDMRRFAGTVIALHHHAAVVGKTRKDRQRGIRIEHVVRIDIGHAFIRHGKRRHGHVDRNAEGLPHAERDIGGGKDGGGAGVGLQVRNIGHHAIAYTGLRKAAISFARKRPKGRRML